MSEGFPAPQENTEMLKQSLTSLADRFLNEENRLAVEEFIDMGQIEEAQKYLLLRIDVLHAGKVLSFEEAKRCYEEIGLTPARAAAVRQETIQKHPRWGLAP